MKIRMPVNLCNQMWWSSGRTVAKPILRNRVSVWSRIRKSTSIESKFKTNPEALGGIHKLRWQARRHDRLQILVLIFRCLKKKQELPLSQQTCAPSAPTHPKKTPIHHVNTFSQKRAHVDRKLSIVQVILICKLECKQMQIIDNNMLYWKLSHAFSCNWNCIYSMILGYGGSWRDSSSPWIKVNRFLTKKSPWKASNYCVTYDRRVHCTLLWTGIGNQCLLFFLPA